MVPRPRALLGTPLNMEDTAEIARLNREREYHDGRFDQETRDAQSKYYWALQSCNDKYAQLVDQAAQGSDVLEYGCALGDWSLKIAPKARRVSGIDISEVAITKATAAAASRGLDNCHFDVMDAQATTFEDDQFDVIFGSGIIHHLDTRKSLQEIWRILKPGGVAIFKEPLGSNIGINVYRQLTPSARTPDEHPLLPLDKAISDSIFSKSEWTFYGLTTLIAVPFRNAKFGRRIYQLTAEFDRMLAGAPGLRWQLWYALLVMRK